MMQLHLKEMVHQDNLVLAGGIVGNHSTSSSTIRVKAPPNGGRWSDHEHKLFLQGIELYGKDWRRIARLVQTRTTVQTRSHAQKHFDRMEKERREDRFLLAERAAKADFIARKASSPSVDTSSVMTKKRTPSAPPKKTTSSTKLPSSELLSNVTFPSAPPPPLAMMKTNFGQTAPRFLDDHMYRYLHGITTKPVLVHELPPAPTLEEFGLPPPNPMECSVLDYISFDDEDESTRPDVEYLFEAMPASDFYSILDETKGGPSSSTTNHIHQSANDESVNFTSEGTPLTRSNTPHDHPVITYEPSISPVRQQRGLSFPRPIRIDATHNSSVMNSIYVE
ncbi:hypothetical protein DYB37_007577 [Aphanomyces astaci]|uniref:Uncharacterized protein n=1 Tax=Aphanomyces astaci TaxID=112090 RepID=A0A3R7APC8_APHAT|nr:hypothetical protein DYB37_007577 [Aphanomyces astaci]